MNRTKIDWCDYTWNPVVGCTNGCPWCYARRFAKRLKCPQCRAFIPHLHPERMVDPLEVKKPSLIFAGSMCDFADAKADEAWFGFAMAAMRLCPQHQFVVLTKHPIRLANFITGNRPDNLHTGVSISAEADAGRVWDIFGERGGCVVSFEPAVGPVDWTPALIQRRISWLIIGAQTGPGAKPVDRDIVASAVDLARAARVPAWVKDNVAQQLPEFAGLQERPF